MRIGVGLPNTVPAAEGDQLREWAHRAERADLHGLSTIGCRLFDGYEELIALTVAGAVTRRIEPLTGVIMVPLYANAVLLAEQAPRPRWRHRA
ncbi:hypothetical protein [Streptomyces parvulus]|uniref:hypothetical protein n=1 Tax=Streptomyces parvulus TaxID=146923 RepID=UPI00380C9D07